MHKRCGGPVGSWGRERGWRVSLPVETWSTLDHSSGLGPRSRHVLLKSTCPTLSLPSSERKISKIVWTYVKCSHCGQILCWLQKVHFPRASISAALTYVCHRSRYGTTNAFCRASAVSKKKPSIWTLAFSDSKYVPKFLAHPNTQ